MVREEYKQRTFTLYFPSPQDLERWKQWAKEVATPLSVFIYETVELYKSEDRSPKLEFVKELAKLREELKKTQEELELKSLALQKLKDDTKLREASSNDSMRLKVNNELIKVLMEHRNRIVTGEDLEKAIGWLKFEKNARETINFMIESYHKSGIIEETERGWRLKLP
jgi:hypothetical protein